MRRGQGRKKRWREGQGRVQRGEGEGRRGGERGGEGERGEAALQVEQRGSWDSAKGP